jgi:hypothetical protein
MLQIIMMNVVSSGTRAWLICIEKENNPGKNIAPL